MATALRDLLALGRRAGTDVGGEPIGEETGEKLEDAKQDASITLHTGKEDRILRRLVLRASFPLERTRDLGGTIGRLRGAEVRFSLRLRRVGRPVRVKAPASAQPFSALNGGADLTRARARHRAAPARRRRLGQRAHLGRDLPAGAHHRD